MGPTALARCSACGRVSSCCPAGEHRCSSGSGDTRSTLGCARPRREPAVHSAPGARGALPLRVPHDGRDARPTRSSACPAAGALALRHAGDLALSLREGRFESAQQGQRAQERVSHADQRAARRAHAQRALEARRGRAGTTGLPNSEVRRERAPAGRWRARVRCRGPVGSSATRAARRGPGRGRAAAPGTLVPAGRVSDAAGVLGPRSPRGAGALPTRHGCGRRARRG